MSIQGLPAAMARPNTRDVLATANSFEILDDHCPQNQLQGATTATSVRNALGELSIESRQNQKSLRSTGPKAETRSSKRESLSPFQKPTGLSLTTTEPNSVGSKQVKLLKSAPIHRRPSVQPDTFKPLGVVEEEDCTTLKATDFPGIPAPFDSPTKLLLEPTTGDENHHPLATVGPQRSLSSEVERHLAGQFDWLMSYPLSNHSDLHHSSSSQYHALENDKHVVYGCNLIAWTPQSTCSNPMTDGTRPANSYSLLATQLRHASPVCELTKTTASAPVLVVGDQPSHSLERPIKASAKNESAGSAISPVLPSLSENSCGTMENLVASGSFPMQRIEDSLEEIDKLEEELEAIDAATRPHPRASRQEPKAIGRHSHDVDKVKTPKLTKRASIAGQFATVRVQNGDKSRPSVRRSASMTMRDRRHDAASIAPEPKLRGTHSRNQLYASQNPPAKPTVKSTKPPTVAKFELSGEAVARRLKEQREARQAQQAEAEKAKSAPPKPRTVKMLPKPTFELPGEAISRRKREEHEARIRAQEEEERKKREFKARPIRQSIGLSLTPRETITSRVRQGKPQDGQDRVGVSNESKRVSVTGARHTVSICGSNGSPQARGRHSIIFPVDDSSRAISQSTGSACGKRSTISSEEAAQQKLRGKNIFVRDNFSFSLDKERERREREGKAMSARAEAAERSRIASREWAEKKRRKELAVKEASHNENRQISAS